jgi:hypothetical protein
MDRDGENKIQDALVDICSVLYDEEFDGLDGCKHINCTTCFCNSVDSFIEFLSKYRYDKNYGNG